MSRFDMSVKSLLQSNYSVDFFFNDTATTEIYTLSLHDALPIFPVHDFAHPHAFRIHSLLVWKVDEHLRRRSEEHTSELQSHSDLVCRLLLEKKKTKLQALSQYLNARQLQPIPQLQPCQAQPLLT